MVVPPGGEADPARLLRHRPRQGCRPGPALPRCSTSRCRLRRRRAGLRRRRRLLRGVRAARRPRRRGRRGSARCRWGRSPRRPLRWPARGARVDRHPGGHVRADGADPAPTGSTTLRRRRRPARRRHRAVGDPDLADTLDLIRRRGAGAVLHRRHRGGRRRRGARAAAGWSARRTWPDTTVVGKRCACPTADRDGADQPAAERRRRLLALRVGAAGPGPGPPDVGGVGRGDGRGRARADAEFFAGLAAPGFARGLPGGSGRPHVSVLDANGWACAVTALERRGIRASSCRGPACTSTTSSVSRTCPRWGSSPRRPGAGCPRRWRRRRGSRDGNSQLVLGLGRLRPDPQRAYCR